MSPRPTPTAYVPDPAAYLAAIGERIRFLRLYQRRTQQQVATDAGMSRSFLNLLEQGHSANITTLFRLAHVLGVNLHDLLPDDHTGHYQRPPPIRPPHAPGAPADDNTGTPSPDAPRQV